MTKSGIGFYKLPKGSRRKILKERLEGDSCDFCKDGTPKYVLPQSNSDLEGSWIACPSCYKFLSSKIKPGQGPQILEISEVSKKLA